MAASFNGMADLNLSSFIWSVADLLRGDYKQSEYGKVILPFTVLRRLDCVLQPTEAKVLAELEARSKAGVKAGRTREERTKRTCAHSDGSR